MTDLWFFFFQMPSPVLTCLLKSASPCTVLPQFMPPPFVLLPFHQLPTRLFSQLIFLALSTEHVTTCCFLLHCQQSPSPHAFFSVISVAWQERNDLLLSLCPTLPYTALSISKNDEYFTPFLVSKVRRNTEFRKITLLFPLRLSASFTVAFLFDSYIFLQDAKNMALDSLLILVQLSTPQRSFLLTSFPSFRITHYYLKLPSPFFFYKLSHLDPKGFLCSARASTLSHLLLSAWC